MLSDADKRAAYDRFGHAGVSAAGSGGFGGFSGTVDLGDIFGDLFGEMFSMGGQQRPSRQRRGDDLRYDMSINFEDAIFGTETEIKIRRFESCSACKGKGSASGRGPSTCPQCQGRGQIRYQQGFFFGRSRVQCLRRGWHDCGPIHVPRAAVKHVSPARPRYR